jgi:hypothetical protein
MNLPVPLERERNFGIMGGGNFHGVEKLEAVCCLSDRFLVTQDAVRPSGTGNIFCQNKKMEGINGPDPLPLSARMHKRR